MVIKISKPAIEGYYAICNLVHLHAGSERAKRLLYEHRGDMSRLKSDESRRIEED